jgi:hypothetical protein
VTTTEATRGGRVVRSQEAIARLPTAAHARSTRDP